MWPEPSCSKRCRKRSYRVLITWTFASVLVEESRRSLRTKSQGGRGVGKKEGPDSPIDPVLCACFLLAHRHRDPFDSKEQVSPFLSQ